ncbi:MAG: SdpI family protein [Clostridia bacterium]|nr:SdpI family protein [Clostridia bacterium]
MKNEIKRLWHEHKMLLVITSAVVLLQTAIGIVLWDRLPEQIATHFDFSNEPNGWSSRTFTVFGMPLILLALHWVCLLVSCFPNHGMMNYGVRIRYLFLFIIPATSLLVMVTCYGYALGERLNVTRMSLIYVGLVFTVTGNYLPKIRRNYATGIKLPWTLSDEENWDKTHRMAAPVWVVCGLVIMVMGLIGAATWIAPAAIIAAVLLPAAYSLALHLKQKNK